VVARRWISVLVRPQRRGDLARQQRGVLRALGGSDVAADDERGAGRPAQVVPDGAGQGLAADGDQRGGQRRGHAIVKAAAMITSR
jgi:hypothetical protein